MIDPATWRGFFPRYTLGSNELEVAQAVYVRDDGTDKAPVLLSVLNGGGEAARLMLEPDEAIELAGYLYAAARAARQRGGF